MPYKDPEVQKQKAKERYRKSIEDRKAKMRDNYQRNKEAYIARAKKSANNRKEEVQKYQKDYREQNKEKSKEYKKQYYQENRLKLLEITKKYLQENPEGQRKRNKKYLSTEKGKARWQVSRNARRKRERHASLGMAFHKEILAIYRQCKQKSIDTGVPHEVDHIIPISHPNISGLHVPWNLQVIPAKVNRQKTNKLNYIDGEDLL